MMAPDRPLVLASADPALSRAVSTKEPGVLRIGPPTTARSFSTPWPALQAWLRGDGPVPPRPQQRKDRRLPFVRSAQPRLPGGAVLLLDGLASWSPALQAAVLRRPDVTIVALLDGAAAGHWQEYGTPETAGAAAILVRRAAVTLVPDSAAAAAVASAYPDATVEIEPRPSCLAASVELTTGARMGEVPYVLACGPIEERANTLLLLQLWRAALAAGAPLPRLVLVGPRGRQVEEIAPLLDWSPALAEHVAEVPGLDPAALRTLVSGAAALLAPDFAHPDAALLRDAADLGVPVITAATPEAIALGLVPLLSPIDGPGWMAAIRAAAAAADRRTPSAEPHKLRLPDWQSYAARLCARARALPRTMP